MACYGLQRLLMFDGHLRNVGYIIFDYVKAECISPYVDELRTLYNLAVVELEATMGIL
jgi:hypothetical protein